MHRDNLNGIDLWNGETKKETRGRDCFVVFLKWISKNYKDVEVSVPVMNRLEMAYRKFYDDDQKKVEVGHYFRNLYHVFKFIDESPMFDESSKARYAKVVRAQLSTPELALLFFNGMYEKGKNFKEYIERYTLLLDLTPRDLRIKDVSMDDMLSIYAKSAFEDSNIT